MATYARAWAAMFALFGSCHDASSPSALTPPVVAPEAPSAPRGPARLEGAAARLEHPNQARSDVTLGERVAAFPIAVPAVGLGQSARFTFRGGRRGWVLKLGEQTLATPAYSRGKVFVGAGFESSKVYALDAHTGALSWVADTPDGGPTAAIVEDDRVLFNTESCTLFAFDLRSGRQRWSHYLGDPLMSQPAAAHGRVFSAYPASAQPGGFAFSAMSLRTGAFLWTRPLGADVLTAPVLVGDAVYATTMDGKVTRFRAADGAVIWRRALEATSAPAVDGDRVYVARRTTGGRERQSVLSARDGAVLVMGDGVRAPYSGGRADARGVPAGWAWEGSRPTYADGRLYHAMGDEIVARDAANGRELWRRRYPGSVARRGVTSPSIAGSQLIVGTRDGDLLGLDIDTGTTAWAYHVGEPIVFQPSVAEGWVYASTASGKVIGLEVADETFDGWHMWGGNAEHNGASPPAPGAREVDPTGATLRSIGADPRALPLLHTSVRAVVTGVIARVTVEQRFGNPSAAPIDAEYLLPLPSDAAVDSMQLHVGARVVRGEIKRRAEARSTFERARSSGRTAALLEQERPNLFRQSVANIRPGEEVRVVLTFAETVEWRDGRYELALPLATGTRYTPGQGSTAPPRSRAEVDLSASLELGAALEAVESPTHPITVARDGAQTTVTLTDGAALPDRDFVLRYRPAVAQVTPALLARRDRGDGFFTLTLHPDVGASAGDITPRELVFVVDASSSMRGAPLAHAKALLRRALDRLRPEDTFRIVRFSDAADELSVAPLSPTPASLASARAWVESLRAAGATEMRSGIRAALSGVAPGGRMRVVVLITDGYIGNEREVIAEVDRSLGAARMFAFGVGSSVNRYLLEQVAESGRGVAEIVTPDEDPGAAAERFYARLDRPLLTDVTVDWGGLAVSDVYPRALPDVFADHPVLLKGRYARGGVANLRVAGRIRGRPWSQTVRVQLPESAQDHEALPVVWARARIHDLTRAMSFGEVPAMREEVTELGLRFGIVTDYTSFVAVDDGAEQQSARGAVPLGSGGSMGSAFGYGGGGSMGVGWGTIGLGVRGMVGRSVGAGSAAALAESELSGRVAVGPMVHAPAPRVQGSIDPEVFRRVVRLHWAEVRNAYERALGNHPECEGRISVRFELRADGSVASATVVDNTTGDPELGLALTDLVRRWVFAPPPEGEVVVVHYPFVFTRETP